MLVSSVTEVYENKIIGITLYLNEDDAVEAFKRLVEEYGTEPDEEMIESGLFEEQDGYTIEIKKNITLFT